MEDIRYTKNALPIDLWVEEDLDDS